MYFNIEIISDFILPDKKHDKIKSSDPDKKKFACAYCGDKFPSKAVRAAHEKFAHVDIEGIFLCLQKKNYLKWQNFTF